MGIDLSFIQSKPGQSIRDYFNSMLKNADNLDMILEYFFISGFYLLYPYLEKSSSIRILMGFSPDFPYIRKNNTDTENQIMSRVQERLKMDLDLSDEDENIEKGISKCLEWIAEGKLKIRLSAADNMNTKLYIMTFNQGDRENGRIITGSTNFTKKNIDDKYEFNTELKDSKDYKYAKDSFEKLWRESFDLNDIISDTINKHTWYNKDIKPHNLYLKFLYEYYKEELHLPDIDDITLKDPVYNLEYQKYALINAKKILYEYGGVFISDIAGIDRLRFSAMLASNLEGMTLVIASRFMFSPDIFKEFNIDGLFCNFEEMHGLSNNFRDKYKNIIIYKADLISHCGNRSYKKLLNLCNNKRVILLTEKPDYIRPLVILDLIRLFHDTKRSTIPRISNLESFFNKMEKKLKSIDIRRNYYKYIKAVSSNEEEMVEKVLKYLIVRVNKEDIIKNFNKDLRAYRISFPEIKKPVPLYYSLDERENKIFKETIVLLTQELNYAFFTPGLYYKEKLKRNEEKYQTDIRSFIKMLLLKRLESSYPAFKRLLKLIFSFNKYFLEDLEKGIVMSKRRDINLCELMNRESDDNTLLLLEPVQFPEYGVDEFIPKLKADIQKDIRNIQYILKLWEDFNRDPKLERLKQELKINWQMRERKIIIFTESKETASYLYNNLSSDRILNYNGDDYIGKGPPLAFDARSKAKDNHNILITTEEAIPESVSFTASDTIINYDIPWNSKRLKERVSRVDRLDNKSDEIFIYNLLPSIITDNEKKLKDSARTKINTYLNLLGEDSFVITEGEPIGPNDLVNIIMTKKNIDGSNYYKDNKMSYFKTIKNIRDKNPELYESIRNLPKKIRSSKRGDAKGLLTYFRDGDIQKFFFAQQEKEPIELDFSEAAYFLECDPSEENHEISYDIYDLLYKNHDKFIMEISEEPIIVKSGHDYSKKLLEIIQAIYKDDAKLSNEQRMFIERITFNLMENNIPQDIVKSALRSLEIIKTINPYQIFTTLEFSISSKYLKDHKPEDKTRYNRNVILSMYFIT